MAADWSWKRVVFRPRQADGSRRGGSLRSSEEGGRYYAAFRLDPDGNNVEAVRREF